jgi:Phage stabilisation protein
MRAVNYYGEASPGGPKKAIRVGRPGLTSLYDLSPGPVFRQYQDAGLFNGMLFSISGGNLYGNGTLIGAIPFSQNPRMAAANNQLAVVAGGALFVYDGTTLTLIENFADTGTPLPSFSGVAVLFNIFIFPVSGSTQFFISATGDATTIDAAFFDNAQTSPGPIIEVSVLAEEIYFSKTDATEIWDFNPIVNAQTGTVTAPFQESPGRTYIRGTNAQGSVVTRLDNAMFWVGDDLEVYRSSGVPILISNEYIHDRLRVAAMTPQGISGITAFSVGFEGHWLYVMNLSPISESYAYDAATKEWAQWGSEAALSTDVGQFLGQCSAGNGVPIWIGSASDGRVWTLDQTNYTDDGATRQVVVSGAVWITGGVQRLNNISLACVRGVGNSAAPNPQAWMRLSFDGGRDFGSWIPGAIGPIGAYNYKATWFGGLGLIRQPGVLVEFRILDPVLAVIEGASYNEARV